MDDTPYQVQATSGLRISTEMSALLHTQIPAEDIDLLNPNVAPFTAYMRDLKKMKPVEGITYLLHDRAEIKHRTALTAAYASGGATQTWAITTGTGTYIPEHSVVLNMTRGTMGQVRTSAASSLTVVPNIDSAGDAAGPTRKYCHVSAPHKIRTTKNHWSSIVFAVLSLTTYRESDHTQVTQHP